MNFSKWRVSNLFRFSSVCFLVIFYLGCSTAPKSTVEMSRSVDECQISKPASDVIETVRSTAKGHEYSMEAYRLIREAEDAAEPPECDSVRAKILADKAKELSDAHGSETTGDPKVVQSEHKESAGKRVGKVVGKVLTGIVGVTLCVYTLIFCGS